MGEFVTVSAFRTEAASEVLEAVRGFFAVHRWRVDRIEDGGPPTEDDIAICTPAGGWTVVMWPAYFTDLPAVEHVSRDLGVLASTVRIHDGDYWSHALLRDGVILDRFASMPDYFTDDPAEIARLTAKYAGRPAAVAEAVGVPVEQIAPYLVHAAAEEDDGRDFYYPMDYANMEPVKAFPDDEFELGLAWVFVDFWRRLGISYPDAASGTPNAAYALRLRLAPGWLGRLPGADVEL